MGKKGRKDCVKMKTYSETIPIAKLFENTKFEIPEIQRDYAWDAKKEVSKLLEDLWKYYKISDHKTQPQYFIGTIIIYSEDEDQEYKQIMDGQQRITSLCCLMAAIKTIIEEESKNANKNRFEELEDMAESIEDDFLFELKNNRPVPKLKPKTPESEATIKKMIQLDGKSPKSAFYGEDTSVVNGRIFKALDWFYTRILELAKDENHDDYLEEIANFYETISKRVVVTLTTTKTIGMAFQMFVSVNGAGKPLNSYDLLRGLLVAKSHSLGIDSKVGTLVRVLNDTMKKIEKRQGGDGKITTCMTYWAEARHGKNIQASDVADVLDQEIRNFTELGEFQEICMQLQTFAWWYDHLCGTRPSENLKIMGYMQNRRILGFADKDQSPWKAQHMMIYAACMSTGKNTNEVNAIMDAFEWVNIRGGWSQIANNMERVYPYFSNKILNLDKVDDWYDELVESLTDVLKDADINGFSHLSNEPISESKATVILHKVRKSYKDPGPQTKVNVCNACQCLPEGAPSPWKCRTEKESPGKISGLLGNWFLLKNKTDKEISKFEIMPMKRVKQMLDNANTGIEVSTLDEIKKKIKNESDWRVSDIRKRTGELLSEAEKSWPEEFVRPKKV